MMSLTPSLSELLWSEIKSGRTKVACDIAKVISISSVGTLPASALRFSRLRQVQVLAQHLVEEQRQPTDREEAIVRDFISQEGHGAADEVATTDEKSCLMIADRRNLAPVLIPFRLYEPTFGASTTIGRALALVERWPAWESLRRHLGQIIVLSPPDGEDTESKSYTLTMTPCVIYMNAAGSLQEIAETIVHESAHNQLNELLSLTPPLRLNSKWFSPWKKTYRPAFGILHACYAFSQVSMFLRWLGEVGVGDWVEDVRRRRLAEHSRLATVRAAFLAACEQIENAGLREWLTTNFESEAAT